MYRRLRGISRPHPSLARPANGESALTDSANLWQLDSSKQGGWPVQELETPRTMPVAVKFTTVETPACMPTNLIGWLPIIWSRVLFGGPHAAPSPLTWRAFALLFVMSGVLLYPCMSFHLF